MQTMTSAYANKMLKSLEEDKSFWENKEMVSRTYVVSVGEEPVIPEYDYAEVAATIEELDNKITVIKHALNLANANARVLVGDTEMSVDTILIRMAQLNKRKVILDSMRKEIPKSREVKYSYAAGHSSSAPEYRYINYDLNQVKQDYEKVSRTILEMQMALDLYNQTVQFEVDI